MKLVFKRLCTLVVVFIICIFSSQQLNVVYGVDVVLHRGSWNSNAQGVRVSIFNLAEGYAEAIVDFIASKGKDAFYSMPVNGVITGADCKLTYLLNYVDNGRSLDRLKWNYNSFAYKGCVIWDFPEDNDAFTPIKYKSGINGNYLYNSDNTFITGFVAKDSGVAAKLFADLGYYFQPQYSSSGLKFLSDEYVVVVEPIYWFVNNMRDDEVVEWFYGSATEWALYSQYVKNISHTNSANDNAIRGNGIHVVMGLLTMKAAPVSTYSHKDREFDVKGTTLKIPQVGQTEINKLISGLSSRNNIDEADTLIMEKFGADYLVPKELYDMSIEIVSTEFRTDTDAVLSFKLQSNGFREFAPAYSDIMSGTDYYGIKLMLETISQSELYLPPMEITCDGLPGSDTDDAFITYAYTDFRTGSRAGIWRFKITAFDADGYKIVYDSNSGLPLTENENSDYYFTISINDINITHPDNTGAEDVMPLGFEVPRADISGLSPVTSLSWQYYEAYAFEDHEGNETVCLDLVTKDKAVSMSGYYPISYGNVPSAKIRNGMLVTKSGYGIGINGTSVSEGSDNMFSSDYQKGVVMFPEYNYNFYGMLIESDGGNGYRMAKNNYSLYKNDNSHSEYSRVHFTPVWYPDGEYNIVVYMFDCWTPAGMLWDCGVYTVIMDGTLYDDWYISRR